MNLRHLIGQWLPAFLKNRILVVRDLKSLRTIHKLACETTHLRRASDVSLERIWGSPGIGRMWDDSKKRMDAFGIPDGSGGVNPGDRRAIYYLISALQPSSVLEVGTHIGASTVHIASALHAGQIQHGKVAELTTVDVADVNSSAVRPWLEHGTKHSPVEMINQLDYGSFVHFVTDRSLDYMSGCGEKFDFIFLDGDHSAKTVYQEIPAALKLLNPDGVVLLHDYHPLLEPLGADGMVIPGPWLALKRLADEGADVAALPLGALPWPTKCGSNLTSLALLLRCPPT